jgi:hypothetical protein
VFEGRPIDFIMLVGEQEWPEADHRRFCFN